MQFCPDDPDQPLPSRLCRILKVSEPESRNVPPAIDVSLRHPSPSRPTPSKQSAPQSCTPHAHSGVSSFFDCSSPDEHYGFEHFPSFNNSSDTSFISERATGASAFTHLSRWPYIWCLCLKHPTTSPRTQSLCLQCPGPSASQSQYILPRPAGSKELARAFPRLASIYQVVRSQRVPNYRGARVSLDHGLNIGQWRKNIHKTDDPQLADFLDFGFPTGFEGKHIPTFGLPNHSSSTAHAPHVFITELMHHASACQ